MEVREVLVSQVREDLLQDHVSPGVIRLVLDSLIRVLGYYEVTEKAKCLAIRDNTNEHVIELFVGSILTEGGSRATAKAYTSVLRRVSREVPKPLLELNSFDIRFWMARVSSGISLSTLSTYRAYLCSFYNWLYREEIIPKNPMDKIRPIKFNVQPENPLSDVDIDTLRSHCTKPRQRAELELLLSCGARVSELCNLNRADVNLDTLSVFISHGKGNKPRICYMSELAKKHLQVYLDTRTDDLEPLFLSKMKQRISSQAIREDLHRLQSLSGVEGNVHPHRCRKTFATTRSKLGMDIVTLKTLMGHSDINTTSHYVNLSNPATETEYRKYSV